MAEKIKGVAIVPGSFDPITNGHVDIVKRAAEIYEKVYLAVMINAEKSYMFSIDERRSIAEAALFGYEGVEVISSEGYLWKLAEELSAVAIVKGVRNEKDRAYEEMMAEYNARYNPKAKTILLECAPGLSDLSSTVVRERISRGEDLSEYLPKPAIDEVNKIISQRF